MVGYDEEYIVEYSYDDCINLTVELTNFELLSLITSIDEEMFDSIEIDELYYKLVQYYSKNPNKRKYYNYSDIMPIYLCNDHDIIIDSLKKLNI